MRDPIFARCKNLLGVILGGSIVSDDGLCVVGVCSVGLSGLRGGSLGLWDVNGFDLGGCLGVDSLS